MELIPGEKTLFTYSEAQIEQIYAAVAFQQNCNHADNIEAFEFCVSNMIQSAL